MFLERLGKTTGCLRSEDAELLLNQEATKQGSVVSNQEQHSVKNERNGNTERKNRRKHKNKRRQRKRRLNE
jgi:hypothetical protein